MLDALGDLTGSRLEADVAKNLVHVWESERISAAVTLLSSSVLRDLPPPRNREDSFGDQHF